MNPKQLDVLKKNNVESRNFVRSCISFALMVLLKEGKQDLSVSKLCNVAGVSRTAFYRNYNDVEEVLEETVKQFGLSLASRIGTDVYDNWLWIFQLTESNFDELSAIIKAGFEHRIYSVFISMLPKDETNYNIQFVWVSLIYAFIVRWVKERKPKKAEDMARLAYKYTKGIPLVAV